MPKDWTPIRGADIQVNRELYKLGFVAVAPRDSGHRFLGTTLSTLGRTFEMIGEFPQYTPSPREFLLADNTLTMPTESQSSSSPISSSSSTSPSSFGDTELSKFLLEAGATSFLSKKPLSKQVKTEKRVGLTLLSKLVNFANAKLRDVEAITTMSSSSSSYAPRSSLVRMQIGDLILSNPKRKVEVFFPLSIADELDSAQGLYVNIWPSLNIGRSNIAFTGFTQYVTAGCLFGASLLGINNNEAKHSLIKHDIKFFEGEKIIAIQYLPNKLHPYETMNFFQLEIMVSTINSLAQPGKKPRLVYHLPYYDYMLFGIELFIRKRITFNALSDLFDAIIQRTNTHRLIIEKICEKHNIAILIESPFKNIFGDLSSYEEANIVATIENRAEILPSEDSIVYERLIRKERARLILEKVNLHTISEDDTLTLSSEADLVSLCLQKLITNEYDTVHQEVWSDFKGTLNPDLPPITTLEDLFKLANTIILGIATKDSAPHSTCSFLSLSEKQIQVEYSKITRKLNESEIRSYAPTINLTALDPILSYDNTSKANAFYFNETARGLSRLIKKTGLLKDASRNVAFFSQGDKPVSLESAVGKDFIKGPSTSRF